MCGILLLLTVVLVGCVQSAPPANANPPVTTPPAGDVMVKDTTDQVAQQVATGAASGVSDSEVTDLETTQTQMNADITEAQASNI